MEAALNGPQGRVALGPTPLRLGRAQDNDFVISDVQASSHHAEIAPGPDGTNYVLTDLGSTNGTFVDEQRLTPQVARPLRGGDVIRIGSTSFSFEIAGSADATVRASSSSPALDATVLGAPPSPSPEIPPTTYGGPASVPPVPETPSTAYGGPASAPPSSYGTPPPENYSPLPAENIPPSPPNYSQPGGYPQQENYSQPGYPSPSAPGYPSAQPGYAPAAGGMGMPGFQPPPQKSKAGLWTALIVVAVLVIGGGIYAVISMNRSTPQKTLDAVCSAFENADGQTLYDQLSNQAKATTTVAKLNQGLEVIKTEGGGIKTCTYRDVQINGSDATATMNIQFNNAAANTDNGDAKTDLVNENGTWKLNEDMSSGQ